MRDHPVLDQVRGTFGQELRQAYRANWREIAKATLILGAVVAGIAGMAWQGARLMAKRRERQAAAQEPEES